MEILLSNCKNVIVDYEIDRDGKTTSFLFEGDVNERHYFLCFELFDTIVEEKSSFFVFDNKIKVVLKKKNDDDDDDNEWPRLQKNKDLYKNAFKVNWDKMEFEEEMGGHYEDMMRQMQMQQMMGGMNPFGGQNKYLDENNCEEEEGEDYEGEEGEGEDGDEGEGEDEVEDEEEEGEDKL